MNLVETKQDKENLELILKIRNENKFNWTTILKRSKDKKYLLDWINEKTPLLAYKKYNLSTKLYWIVNNLTDFPSCSYSENGICPLGNEVKQKRNIDNFEIGFRACSKKCPGLLRKKQIKTEETNLKKYGSKSFLSSEEGKKKIKNWLERNGVDNTFQIESVKSKSKQTRKQKYGYEYTMQDKNKQNLAKETYKSKTGYYHQFKDPKVREKIKETLKRKIQEGYNYGEIKEISQRKRRYQEFLASTDVKPLFSEEEYIKLNRFQRYSVPLKWKCLKCGNEFEAIIDGNFSARKHIPVRCLNCYPFMCGESEAERNIVSFIKENFNGEVKIKDRSLIFPFELDIYIPEKKLAIEYDGIYWHAQKERLYHLKKTELCEKLGIQLIHVFEDEWLNKQEIVKSRLRNFLGKFDKIIYARKCEVKEIEAKYSKKFQLENHIQGFVNSKINLGLYFENELVSLLTINKSRFAKSYEYELVRFCSKLNYHVVGAASKLLKYFEENYKPKSIISYADRRWSIGNIYKKLGFQLISSSRPNYWYFKKNSSTLFNRMIFQKYKLRKILENFDEKLSEVKNMEANGYQRIFDCGNLVFVKKY